MNWGEFKDPASLVCVAGDVRASSFLTQEEGGSNPFTETIIFVIEFAELNGNI